MKACTKKIVQYSLLFIQLLSTDCCLFNFCPQEAQSYPNKIWVQILTCGLWNIGTIFLYNNVLIRSFILVK